MNKQIQDAHNKSVARQCATLGVSWARNEVAARGEKAILERVLAENKETSSHPLNIYITRTQTN